MKKILLKGFLDSLSDNRISRSCTELRRSIQNRKWLGLSVIAFMLVMVVTVASAQQPKKLTRLG
jgi:hypothetical protein